MSMVPEICACASSRPPSLRPRLARTARNPFKIASTITKAPEILDGRAVHGSDYDTFLNALFVVAREPAGPARRTQPQLVCIGQGT